MTDVTDSLDQWLAAPHDDGSLLAADSDVCTAASLRFDGYRYLEQYGYHNDFHPWMDRWATLFRENGQLPATDTDAMSLCFLYQRFFGKWGGEYEAPNSFGHRHWRSLILQTISIPTPAEWQPVSTDPTFGRQWDAHWTPRLDDAVRCVREVHGRMRYDDDAKLLIEFMPTPADLLQPRD